MHRGMVNANANFKAKAATAVMPTIPNSVPVKPVSPVKPKMPTMPSNLPKYMVEGKLMGVEQMEEMMKKKIRMK